MPCIDIEQLSGCNCFKEGSDPANIIIKPTAEPVDLHAATSQLSISDNTFTSDEPNSNLIQFPIKGSTYCDIFQKNLKTARKYISNASSSITLFFKHEPSNPKDRNAILICASIDGEALPLGYVPGPRIAQIKHVLASDSVTQINLVVTRKFIPVVGKNIYLGELRVISTMNFIKIDTNYVYNQVI